MENELTQTGRQINMTKKKINTKKNAEELKGPIKKITSLKFSLY